MHWPRRGSTSRSSRPRRSASRASFAPPTCSARSRPSTTGSSCSPRNASMPRIGIVGATGAVGHVTLDLLAERGYDDVRAFASERSAGSSVPFGGMALVVEEATPEALSAGDVDLFLFSVGTSASKALVPEAHRGGALVVDKSSAYRLVDGYP